MKTIRLLLLLLLLVAANAMGQQLKLADGFSDGMVLQCDKPLRIFGTGAPGQTVNVRFGKARAKAVCDEGGRWLAELPAQAANARQQMLTVTMGRQKVTLSDVLVGEVWLCSGQSNMEFNMSPVWRGGSTNKVDKTQSGIDVVGDELARLQREGDGANPLMRAIVIEKELKTDTLPTTGWHHVTAATVSPVSELGYFFAKELIDSLQVPVGIIVSCWGGSPITAWIPGGTQYGEGKMYEHMVAPLAPMTMRGYLWYQGEADLTQGQTSQYYWLQQKLMRSWRKAFDDQTLSFLYVQLAPYDYSSRRYDVCAHDWMELARFRKVQDDLQHDKTEPCSMASIIDLCDNLKDIHPTYKWEVAHRLILLAMRDTYGRPDVVAEGPRMTGISYEDGTAIVTFSEALTTRDGKEPCCFECSGDGLRFRPATEVKVEGNRVILRCDKWPKVLKDVRYAWDEAAITNLCSAASGLPVWPFNTQQ